MPNHTVASVIIDGLKAVGIDRLYCLPGVQNDDFFNALYDQTDQIKVVNSRHEQGAGYMALGAAMATGRPQAYCVVPGPGLLNSSGALATAFGLSTPVLALSGQIPTQAIGKMYGMLHELPDQLAILSQITKYATGIYGSETAVEQVQHVMTELVSGQPRTVGVEVPMDIWGQPVEDTGLPLKIERQLPALDDDAIEAAAKLLGQAKQPLIVCGGFLYNASEISTAIKYSIPLTTIVFADGAYGNVKRIQQQRYEGRTIASDLVNPDFVKLAESYGAMGLRAESPDQLRSALREAFKANHPAIIEVPVDEMPDPWSHLLLPPVRGEGITSIF